MLIKEKNAIFKKLASLSLQDVNWYATKPRSKDEEASERARQQGNKLFQQKSHSINLHTSIWELYSRSIALAPTESETLALAFGNRSALLFDLLLFKDCILDIDRAIKITKSNVYEAKLLCRKAKCLHALGSPETNDVLLKAKSYVHLMDDQDAIKIRSLIETTEIFINRPFEKKSEYKPSLIEIKREIDNFQDLAINYDSKHKTHLIATRDIAPGEIVCVEKPYVTSILHLVRANSYCSHCYDPCLTTIPCPTCTWCMFCSEKCRKNAWNQYHDIECPIFKDYKEVPNSEYPVHMALHLIVTEWRKHGSVAKLKSFVKNIDKKKDYFSGKLVDNKVLHDNKLEIIYFTLKNSSLELPEIDIEVATDMLVSLAVNTTFFGKNFCTAKYKNLANDGDIVFIGALILKFIYLSTFSVIMSKIAVSQRDTDPAGECMGICLPTIYNVFGHNCDPNVTRAVRDNKLIIYAIKPIKKNEQMFVSQSESYRVCMKPIRQMNLKKSFGITCKCQACQENWLPTSNIALNMIEVFPTNFDKILFKTPLERHLFKKHETVLLCKDYIDPNMKFTEEMALDVGQSVATAVRELPQPSYITSLLIRSLIYIFLNLYGYVQVIPYVNCSKSKSIN
ncbi:uncharacterized protein LOC106646403 [Copidosoma floridanum]|uniref:uncharacterized protein LOC106646403 n=1 Tax=Copidosoma floridanum TaxID=29053 RepID=UPI0006C9D8E8|nr:uncharacterized protein LOC106646403 [Copidosoma floridanum]